MLPRKRAKQQRLEAHVNPNACATCHCNPPEEEARDALAEAAGEEAVADGAAEDAADATTGGEEAEVEAASVGDDDADSRTEDEWWQVMTGETVHGERPCVGKECNSGSL